MSDTRKKSGAFWWSAAALFVLAYPLSFGPACWISERTEDDGKVLSFLYGPIIRIGFAQNHNGLVTNYLMWGVWRNTQPVIDIQHGTISWSGFWYSSGPSDPKRQQNLFLERPMPPAGFGGFGGSMGGP